MRWQKKIISFLLGLAVLGGLWSALHQEGEHVDAPDLPVASLPPPSPEKPEQTPKKSAPSEEAAKVTSSPSHTRSRPAPSPSPSFIVTSQPVSRQAYDIATVTLVAQRQGQHWVMQGDILVPESALEGDANDDKARLVTLESISLWPDGIVPYVIDDTLEAGNVHEALAEINEQSMVRFVPRRSEADYVIFRRAPASEEVCQSRLGRQGGEQEIIIHPTCGKGQILHEMLHALGFVHEHSREDRDAYVVLHWDNMKTEAKNQFQKMPAAVSQLGGQDFDFDSIMLYPSFAFSANGKATITKNDASTYTANREHLSRSDIGRINTVYGHSAGH